MAVTGNDIVKLFYANDKDGDGKLNVNEFIAMMQAINGSLCEDELRQLIAVVDTSQDGFIQIEEIMCWIFGTGSAYVAYVPPREAGPIREGGPVTVRYVRLEQRKAIIHVQAVEVYDESGCNCALLTAGAIASQSSECCGGDASLPLNGIIDDAQPWPNSNHTEAGSAEWWEVDLQKEIQCTRIVVYNRPDCCQDRLSGCQVKLLDGSRQQTYVGPTLDSSRKQEVLRLKSRPTAGNLLEATPSFSEIDESALEFYRTNGFLLFSEGTVPLELLEATRPFVEAGAPGGCSCASEIFDLFYKTKLYEFITKMLGADPPPDFSGWVQVASIGSDQIHMGDVPDHPLVYAVGPHIDLGHDFKPCCHKPAGTHLHRFCMLLGIPFEATPKDYMGNFGVFRGSHLKVAQLFQEQGYGRMFFRPEHMKDRKHPHYSGARFGHAFGQIAAIPDQGEPVVFKLKLGQAYIAHFNTIHWVQKNIRNRAARNVVYFRIQHPRSHHEYDKGAFANLWRDYPCFGGTWSAEEEESSREEEEHDPPPIVEDRWEDWVDRAQFFGKHEHWSDSVFFKRDTHRFQKTHHDPGSWSVSGNVLLLKWDLWGEDMLTSSDGGQTFATHGFALEGNDLPCWWLEQFR